MPLLFSYGTLQQEDMQRSTFGRVLAGERDDLPGFAPATVKIEDPQVVATTGRTHHANVVRSRDATQRVPGTVFEVTDEELAAADAYEQTAAYSRINVKLGSGKEAWVYVSAGQP